MKVVCSNSMMMIMTKIKTKTQTTMRTRQSIKITIKVKSLLEILMSSMMFVDWRHLSQRNDDDDDDEVIRGDAGGGKVAGVSGSAAQSGHNIQTFKI